MRASTATKQIAAAVREWWAGGLFGENGSLLVLRAANVRENADKR